jgi:hypothetical protein
MKLEEKSESLKIIYGEDEEKESLLNDLDAFTKELNRENQNEE